MPGQRLRGFLREELASMVGEFSKGEENEENTGMVFGELGRGSMESEGFFSLTEKGLIWVVLNGVEEVKNIEYLICSFELMMWVEKRKSLGGSLSRISVVLWKGMGGFVREVEKALEMEMMECNFEAGFMVSHSKPEMRRWGDGEMGIFFTRVSCSHDSMNFGE